MIDVITP